MAVTSSNVDLSSTSWTLVHTAGSTTPGFQLFSRYGCKLYVGSGSPSGNPSSGVIVMQPGDNSNPSKQELNVDSGDKVYARLLGGSGRMTVVA